MKITKMDMDENVYARLLERSLPRVIRTEEKLTLVTGELTRIDELANPSPEEKELAELLTALINEYEARHYPIRKASPRKKDHGDACPGLVDIDVYGDGKPTLALVLNPENGKKEKAKLVVAHQISEGWRTALLETANSSAPVVWSQDPGEYHDVYGKKKIRATSPVLVFCGYESWTIL